MQQLVWNERTSKDTAHQRNSSGYKNRWLHFSENRKKICNWIHSELLANSILKDSQQQQLLAFDLEMDHNELFAAAGATTQDVCVRRRSGYYVELELGVDLADAFQRVDTKSYFGGGGDDAFAFGVTFLHELLAAQSAATSRGGDSGSQVGAG